jgi:LemA protein
MLNGILVIFGAIVIIVLLWGTIIAKHLKTLTDAVEAEWWLLYESLSKKSDLIPNLIETIRMYDQSKEDLFKQLIDQRSAYNKEYFPFPSKIEKELDLNKTLKEVVDWAVQQDRLKSDTNFLELKKEIYDLNKNIEERTRTYNTMVRYYNDRRNFSLIKPVATLFKYDHLNIFETEY